MTTLLPALGVAFAAFCVWLGVRIVNRRERWAKTLAVVLASSALLYVLSIGPVYWLAWQDYLPEWTDGPLDFFYTPIHQSPKPIHDAVNWYVHLWI